MSLQRGINLRVLAEKMGQCSGAEVRGICTEAGRPGSPDHVSHGRELIHLLGMYALRERRQHVTQEDFEFAIAKVGRHLLSSDDVHDLSWCAFYRFSRRTRKGTHLLTNFSHDLFIASHSCLVLIVLLIHAIIQSRYPNGKLQKHL